MIEIMYMKLNVSLIILWSINITPFSFICLHRKMYEGVFFFVQILKLVFI